MSLSRAFTGKRTKAPQISAPMPQRSGTTKQFPVGTIRHKISAPVVLLSTTNMLSYNAPSLYPQSSTSSRSGDDSDSLPALSTSSSTTPDNSSAGSPPSSPEPNHLSCYFKGSSESVSAAEDAPLIPQRALSHTKKSHEKLHRQHSISRLSSEKNSVSSFARDSARMFSGQVESGGGPEPHPFGNELAQVTELAEEYGAPGRLHVIDEEEQELISKGLFKFDAQEYRNEIESFFADAFGDVQPTQAMWI